MAHLVGVDLDPEWLEGVDAPFTTSEGLVLNTTTWGTLASKKPVVILVHGYGHYTRGLGLRLVGPLVKAGFAVTGLDARGHGRSGGMRALVRDYRHLLLDLGEFVQSIKSKTDAKIFLLGQSMGGGVSVLTAMDKTLGPLVAGMILLAPMCAMAPEMHPPAWQVSFLTWMAWALPWAPIAPVPQISHLAFTDQEARARHHADPVSYHGGVRLGTALALLTATQDIEARLGEVHVPFLVLHGSDDFVTACSASQRLHAEASSKDKTFILYEKMRHVLNEEPDRHRVMGDILKWLEARV